MADIPITRRPRRRIWPLILLVLLVALVGAWYWWSSQPAVPQTRTSSIHVTPVATGLDAWPRLELTPITRIA